MKRLVTVLVLVAVAVPLVYLYAQDVDAPLTVEQNDAPPALRKWIRNAVSDAKLPSLLTVWVKTPAQGGMLENARVESLGGRHFIVGRVPKLGQDNQKEGKTYWFPVDDILGLIEFRDLDEAREYYEKRGEQPQ